jgi:hypothetical protein
LKGRKGDFFSALYHKKEMGTALAKSPGIGIIKTKL